MQEKLSRKEIGQRIKSLRLEMNHSQSFMANLLQVSRSNYSQIEIGNQYPTFELLVVIARYYSKSYEWLLHGNESASSAQVACQQISKALPKSSKQKKGTILKISSGSDYISKLNDAVYLNNLQPFDVSLTILNEEGNHRAFIIENPSCLKNIYTGDILVGKLLNNLSQIISNEIYIVITLTEIIFCKIVDVIANGEILIYKNDETNKSFVLNFNDIQEVWMALGKYSTVIQPATENLEKMICAMNETIINLEVQLNKLNKKMK